MLATDEPYRTRDSVRRSRRDIRVLIAEDCELFQEGLALYCDADDGITVVGRASTARQALALARSTAADVVLMDVGLPDMDGIRACQRLREMGSRARVIMLTGHRQPRLVVEAIRAGAVGYLPKDVKPKALLAAIRSVHGGDVVVDPELAASTLVGIHAPDESPKAVVAHDLTRAEHRVLELVARGRSNAEIAHELRLADSTVSNRLRAIFQKLDVSNRTQAALVALQRGWVPLESPGD